MMHRDGPERRDAGKGKNIRSDVIIGGEERMKWKAKKKSPLPDVECPFFFLRVRGEQGPLQTTTVVPSAQ
jgi:hypothetical protein